MERAISVLRKSMQNWDGVSTSEYSELKEEDLLIGYKSFSDRGLKLVPGDTWRWNRAADYEAVEIKDGVMARISKMNSRTKVSGVRAPRYKVWLYTIYKDDSRDPFFFIWCEKGSYVRLEQYAFLRCFVSDSLAKEFHWTK